MRHIHRRNVCRHGHEGAPCHPGNHKAVGEARCEDTPCPLPALEPHPYKAHKSGFGCTCGFGPRERCHI